MIAISLSNSDGGHYPYSSIERASHVRIDISSFFRYDKYKIGFKESRGLPIGECRMWNAE